MAARRADPTVGQETFHLWLTLARLLSVSHGETALTLGRWRQARELEARRIERARVC